MEWIWTKMGPLKGFIYLYLFCPCYACGPKLRVKLIRCCLLGRSKWNLYQMCPVLEVEELNRQINNMPCCPQGVRHVLLGFFFVPECLRLSVCLHVPMVCCLISEGRWAQRGFMGIIFYTADKHPPTTTTTSVCVRRAWHFPPGPAYSPPAWLTGWSCEGRLRTLWKVGQTVGTFLQSCFCKVGKGRGALNHQHFSIVFAWSNMC